MIPFFKASKLILPSIFCKFLSFCIVIRVFEFAGYVRLDKTFTVLPSIVVEREDKNLPSDFADPALCLGCGLKLCMQLSKSASGI